MEQDIFDVQFKIQGETIAGDYNYFLYSAISHICPWIHQIDDYKIGIHPIKGCMKDRRLILTKNSFLILRIPENCLKHCLVLGGRTFNIGADTIAISSPTYSPLYPSHALWSYNVTVRAPDKLTPEIFFNSIKSQLEFHKIKAIPSFMLKQSGHKKDGIPNKDSTPYIWRTFNIKGKHIVGYPLVIQELSSEDSIKLQQVGLGGRRHFGCGIFVPFEQDIKANI
jgi:CRISPR-associated protein Cas6